MEDKNECNSPIKVNLAVNSRARPATEDDICSTFFGKSVDNLVKEIRYIGVEGVKKRISSS